MLKVFRKIFSRIALVSLALFLQISWFLIVTFLISEIYLPFAVVLNLFSLIATIFIIYRPGNPMVKMAWIVPILVFPLFGGVIFAISGGKGPKKKLRRALDKSEVLVRPYEQGNFVYDSNNLRPEDRYIRGQCHYLAENNFPLYCNCDATYFDNGYDGWVRMLDDLRHAEKFIFLEYFIIRSGVMWDPILEILREKASAGLDVRIMYDDVGSISYLPRKYPEEMEKWGIKCVAFNRYRPVYSVVMNHRDHRKILSIDGNVAYTGGSNFADEYIGESDRCGEWKDNFLRLEGEAVRSLTLMFLHMWNAVRPTESVEDVAAFMPDPEKSAAVHCDGLIQPYGNSPVDSEMIAGSVYLNIINQSTDYCYILSPYLVIDYETSRALCLAAARGVDVRLVVPAIPDKKIVYHLTQSYFPELIENGVKIYKFTPGFVHSKCFVSDDRIAVVGTINMDFRSLSLHFENACLFVDHPVIADVRADFDKTFPRCEEVKVVRRRFGVLYSAYLGILRLFAPLF